MPKVISEQCPEYIDSFDKVMNGSDLYYYNMFIAPKEIISGYCEWVFPLLFEVEKEWIWQAMTIIKKNLWIFNRTSI